ncbi:MAG: hypothetical protein J0H84_26125 [Rhizobiales bacterium]|nr:hypothetical protein [Hyphomicrobiales bacterium]
MNRTYRTEHLGNSQDSGERTVNRNGTIYTMNKSAIGNAAPKEGDDMYAGTKEEEDNEEASPVGMARNKHHLPEGLTFDERAREGIARLAISTLVHNEFAKTAKRYCATGRDRVKVVRRICELDSQWTFYKVKQLGFRSSMSEHFECWQMKGPCYRLRKQRILGAARLSSIAGMRYASPRYCLRLIFAPRAYGRKSAHFFVREI